MTFSITTFGCKVNSCESAAIHEAFIAAGYSPVEDGAPADICIINSCAVTGAGVKKARQAVSHCRTLNPDCITVLCGCYPQAYPDEAARDSGADIITGNADKSRLPQLVEQFVAEKQPLVWRTAYAVHLLRDGDEQKAEQCRRQFLRRIRHTTMPRCYQWTIDRMAQEKEIYEARKAKEAQE